MADESVKVAVRIRPFNQRERDRNAKCVLSVEGNVTRIYNPDAPNEPPKSFTFDYSYWSHDGFDEDDDGVSVPVGGSHYASQQKVFDDLGQGVLKNALEGYNCSLFAYGQTGAGKSYSMVGYGKNKGIVPMTCDELFNIIEANTDPDMHYEVLFSMLEIYNEQVRDLLSKDCPKGGLMVRQNTKDNCFYVQGLKKVPVGSYLEIEKRMEQGTAQRTVASTNMNASSSRAHTLVTIQFDQVSASGTRKSSTMNLVDLAGSERAGSTGATGDRLKEGANINKSLSALGNVISALADKSNGKKKVQIPYRDSVLTKLLQNALGGNSKTIMIAALSPADINFDETLSTLRYADRAKQIKTKAVINENPVDKMMRELREENERLRKLMESGVTPTEMQSKDGKALSEKEIAKLRAQMADEIKAQMLANAEAMAMTDKSWDQKLEQARQEGRGQSAFVRARDNTPHITNLNEDPMLSGVVFHLLEDGANVVGKKADARRKGGAKAAPAITLSGVSIQAEHALLKRAKSDVTLESVDGAVKVNGVDVLGQAVKLKHNDRILFGSNHMYIFVNPLKPTKPAPGEPKTITWEFAQKEIAEAKGYATAAASGLTRNQQDTQEIILELLPQIAEVNAISEEMNKKRSFELCIIAWPDQTGQDTEKGVRCLVKMKNLVNGNFWLWDHQKFNNRKFLMQEMYEKYLDGADDSDSDDDSDDDDDSESEDHPSKEKHDKSEWSDPFWEPPETVMIGTANVFLQSLAYGLDFEDKIAINNFKGKEEGSMIVSIGPCGAKGQSLGDDYYIDEPEDLLGTPYHVKLTIVGAELKQAQYSKGVSVRYRLFNHDDEYSTDVVTGTLGPQFNYSKVFSFKKINDDHLKFFEAGCITFMIFAEQDDTAVDVRMAKMTTREIREIEKKTKAKRVASAAAGGRRGSIAVAASDEPDSGQMRSELMVVQRRLERMEEKDQRVKEVIDKHSSPSSSHDFDQLLSDLKNANDGRPSKMWRHAGLVGDLKKLHNHVIREDENDPYGLGPEPKQGDDDMEVQNGIDFLKAASNGTSQVPYTRRRKNSRVSFQSSLPRKNGASPRAPDAPERSNSQVCNVS